MTGQNSNSKQSPRSSTQLRVAGLYLWPVGQSGPLFKTHFFKVLSSTVWSGSSQTGSSSVTQVPFSGLNRFPPPDCGGPRHPSRCRRSSWASSCSHSTSLRGRHPRRSQERRQRHTGHSSHDTRPDSRFFLSCGIGPRARSIRIRARCTWE